jgi:hypothetical protein
VAIRCTQPTSSLPSHRGYNSIDYPGAFTHCTHAHGWLMSITYQTADRFWLFRALETALFAGLAGRWWR